ncbi:MAG: surF1 family protein, partial [Caulobacteraceae bacterium]|nr:surF1 family protein [Caulobacteraceae bacterium]
FPIGMTVASAVALALLIGLGVWQLQRLKWKEGLLAAVAQAQTTDAQLLEDALLQASHGSDVSYRRVIGLCRGLSSAPFVELYAIKDGEMGWRLISACKLENAAYDSILVDRGFMPDADQSRPRIDPLNTLPVAVRGVLRAPEKPSWFAAKDDPAHHQYFTRQIGPMAQDLGLKRPAPYVLTVDSSADLDFPAIKPYPLPLDIPNHHLDYALTWFGLAGGLACVYAAALWRRMKGR